MLYRFAIALSALTCGISATLVAVDYHLQGPTLYGYVVLSAAIVTGIMCGLAVRSEP
jgi:hypothetical protein